MSEQEQSKPSTGGFKTRVKDHLEMIVVAFIMALVIRCFFVEVFKIPTGSMEPTLMGNNERTREGGDRIMVNKFYYLFHDVERFDVIVFRYPLNVMRNFIKRAVGIGPEYIRMEDGDIYHADDQDGPFRIARKSFEKQQSIWIPLPPGSSNQKGTGILDTWRRAGSDGATAGNPEYLTLQSQSSPTELIFDRPVKDAAVTLADRHRQRGRHRMKDLKIDSVISRLGSDESLTYELVDGSFRFSLHLSGGDEARFKIHRAKKENDKTVKTFPLPEDMRDEKHHVEFFVYDGQAGVTIDGKLVEMHRYRNRYGQRSSIRRKRGRRPRLRVKQGSVRLHKLSLFRDIYYHWGQGESINFEPRNEPIKIPENRLLVIGDNVNSSRDSRKWKMRVFRSTDQKKQRYIVDERTWRRAMTGQRTHVVDRSGRRLQPSTLKNGYRSQVKEMRFVRKELLVGKAIWVWWPYDRMKFIR